MYQVNIPFSISGALTPIIPFRNIAERFPLFMQLVQNNLSAKFRKSRLGFLWLFIPHLCILLLYIYVFSHIFKMKWPESSMESNWSFGLSIYTGIILYSLLSDSIMESIGSISRRVNYVKKISFPLDLLPVSTATANFLVAVIILLIIGLVSLASGGTCNHAVFMFLPLMIPMWLLACGCAWIASVLGVFFRDIGNLLGILLLVLFFTAPVFYSLQAVPENLRFIAWCNPLTAFVINVRNVLLFNAKVDWQFYVISIGYGSLFFQGGFFLFSLARRRFADVI